MKRQLGSRSRTGDALVVSLATSDVSGEPLRVQGPSAFLTFGKRKHLRAEVLLDVVVFLSCTSSWPIIIFREALLHLYLEAEET